MKVKPQELHPVLFIMLQSCANPAFFSCSMQSWTYSDPDHHLGTMYKDTRFIEVFLALKYSISDFLHFKDFILMYMTLTSIYCTRTLYTTSTFQCYQFSIIYANMVYWCTLSYLYDWGIGSIPVVGFPLKELVVLIF